MKRTRERGREALGYEPAQGESQNIGNSRRGHILILLIVLCLSACGQKQVKVVAPPAPVGPPEHEVLYREGLKAFREGTQEGYLRASDLFRRADKLSPRTCEYTMHLAESLFFLAQKQKVNWEDFQPAVAEAKTALFFKQGSPECNAFGAYVTRVTALGMTFDQLRTVEVVAMIRRAIDLDPEDALNYIVLTQADPEPARGAAPPSVRAAALRPDLAVVHNELGNYYLRNQATFIKARESFERALQLNPRHYESIVGIVYSLSNEGDDAADKVEPLLKKAAEIAPTALKVRTLLGDHYAGMEETDLAVEQYRAATSLAPTYYPAHLATGTTFATAERSFEAEAAFNEVVKLDVRRPHPPHNGIDFTADGLAHYYLGNIWLDRGELEKAKAEYTIAISDIQNYPAAVYGLGIVAYKEGRVDDALAKLNQVIQQEPERFPNAYLARGGIRAERKQYNEALTDLVRAIDLYRAQAVSLEARAKLDEEKGRIKRAEGQRRRKAAIEAALEKAIESRKTVEALRGGKIQL